MKGEVLMLNVFKRFLSVSALLCLLAVLGACSRGGAIEEYFPLNANKTYHYIGGVDDVNSYSEFPLFISGGRVQFRVDTAESPIIQIMTVKDGGLWLQHFESQGFGEHTGGENRNHLLLQAPIRKGTKWNYLEVPEGNITAEITAVGLEVTTAYGTFTDVIRVEITDARDTTIIYYYAKDYGLIKRVMTRVTITEFWDAAGNVIQEMTEAEVVEDSFELGAITDGPLTASSYMFYPRADGQIAYRNMYFAIPTNADTKAFIMDTLRAALTEHGISLSAGTALKSAVTDRNRYTVDFDFSASFINDLRNSPVGEAAAFKSVISTLCYFFDHFYARVTVDGALYVPEGIETLAEDRFESVYHFNAIAE
jgi:hypothetical protein